jgi:DNA-binding transcriptional MerR regulator
MLQLVSASWTIRELRQRVEQALAGDDAPANRQVRAVPDERSIRYYTTLGLLDRPSLRGRTALYGPRHLAQLITIKRWQAEGRSLADIQQQLPTLDDAGLAGASGVELVAPPRATARRDFWRTEAVSAPEPAPEPAPESESEPEPDLVADSPATLLSFVELSLSPGVRLAFETSRPATDADATALLAAAQPLLAELRRRHLITTTLEPLENRR